MLLDELLTFGTNQYLVEALASHARFMVIGGSAIRFRFPHWQTDDLDLLVEPLLANAERVRAGLQDMRVDCSGWTANDLTRQNQQITLKARQPGFNADVITPFQGFDFPDHYAQAGDARIGATPIKVATLETVLVLIDASTEPKHLEKARHLRLLMQAQP
jgi:hypothetical protein